MFCGLKGGTPSVHLQRRAETTSQKGLTGCQHLASHWPLDWNTCFLLVRANQGSACIDVVCLTVYYRLKNENTCPFEIILKDTVPFKEIKREILIDNDANHIKLLKHLSFTI